MADQRVEPLHPLELGPCVGIGSQAAFEPLGVLGRELSVDGLAHQELELVPIDVHWTIPSCWYNLGVPIYRLAVPTSAFVGVGVYK
jgi:hypothetical protein